MSRLCIASLLPTLHFDGLNSRALALARSIDRKRFEHLVVSMTRREELTERGSKWMIDAYEKAGSRILYLDSDLMSALDTYGPGRLPRSATHAITAALQFSALIREQHVDVVDAYVPFSIGIASVACRLNPSTAVVAFDVSDRTWRHWLVKRLRGPIWSRVDALVSDSENRLLTDEKLRDASRSFVIPNGVPWLPSDKTREDLRAEVGLPADALVIGLVARLHPKKGQDQLLRAAAPAMKERADAWVLIVGYSAPGSGWAAQLRALAIELGISDRVVITPWDGESSDIWRTIDICLLPTKCDSSPISLHECMAAGVPIVATRIGGIHELVEDGVGGFIVEPEDLGPLTAALDRLLEDPELARRMGNAGRERFESRHHPSVMARALEDVFISASRRRRPGGVGSARAS